MTIYGLEEHMATTEVVKAWKRADPGLTEPMVRWAVEGDVTQALLDLDDRLSNVIAELLAVHHVPAHLLHVEITESALMIETNRAKCLLEKLDQVGIIISIDDFGAGYTSLGQLKSLPIKELKIDRSFVTPISGSRSDALIVHSVIELGHNLGMTIVAEGVEDVQSISILAGFGCDIIQGYHLSPPIPADAFDLWFLAHKPTQWRSLNSGSIPGTM